MSNDNDTESSNFTGLKVVEQQNLNEICYIFWNISIPINTAILLFMIFVILKCQEIAEYKWFLLQRLIWCYFFCIFIALWKPVSLFPLIFGYSNGIFKNFSRKNAFIQIFSLNFFETGFSFSILILFIHRWIKASPKSKYFQNYNHLKLRWYITIFAVFYAIFYVGPQLYDISEEKILYEIENKNFDPIIFRIYQRENSFIGLIPMFYDDVREEVKIQTFKFSALIFLLIFCSLNYLRILFFNKQNLSNSEYLLEKQFFQLFIFQTFFIIFILFLPLIFFLQMGFTGAKWGPAFLIIALMLASIFLIFESLAMIFCIKAFQKIIFNLFKHFFTKVKNCCYCKIC